MTAYEPLHDPGCPAPTLYSLDVEIAVTRRVLDETASLNIHSDDDMRQAAFALNARLRALHTVIEAERGES